VPLATIMNAQHPKLGGPVPRDRSAPTHAGGIVWRRLAGGLQFLLVRALARGGEGDIPAALPWVLPKGHIERGEGPEEAALREVLEEAGAVAELGPLAGTLEFSAAGKVVRCAFYAMELRGQREADEPREMRWATLAEVRQLVPYPETVALVERVAELVHARG
jgi:ADP-ribose pyrophosphatase YjhB (NUDIX family)